MHTEGVLPRPMIQQTTPRYRADGSEITAEHVGQALRRSLGRRLAWCEVDPNEDDASSWIVTADLLPPPHYRKG